MKIERILVLALSAVFSVSVFATQFPDTNAGVSTDMLSQQSTGIIGEQVSTEETFKASAGILSTGGKLSIFGALAIIIVGGIVLTCYTIKGKFSELSEVLDKLNRSIGGLKKDVGTVATQQKQNQNCYAHIGGEISQSITALSQKCDKSCDYTISYVNERTEQHTKELTTVINEAAFSVSQSVSASGLTDKLELCVGKANNIAEKMEQILSVAPKLDKINEELLKLIEERPELVNLSIDNAVGLLKQCYDCGIASVEQIKEMSAVVQQCTEAHFASLSEIVESKKYYDARDSYAAAQKEAEEKIGMLERELSQAAEKNRQLLQAFNSLCPEKAGADSLFAILQDSTPEIRAETVVLISQLYWFAQLYRNAPAKIKAAFAKFDETLYDIFSERQELLQSIRGNIQNFVNTEVFKGTSYEIFWPVLNSSASEREECYNRENNEGNRICKVRSAVILNAGNIESVARIYTSL